MRLVEILAKRVGKGGETVRCCVSVAVAISLDKAYAYHDKLNRGFEESMWVVDSVVDLGDIIVEMAFTREFSRKEFETNHLFKEIVVTDLTEDDYREQLRFRKRKEEAKPATKPRVLELQ